MTEDLPAGWAMARLEQLVGPGGLMSDGDWVESKDQDPEGEVRLLQLADIGAGEFRDRSNRFLTAGKAHDLNCTFLEQGDVLISRLGDVLGKACLAPPLRQRAVTVVDVHVFRSGSEDVSHRWLMHLLNSQGVQRQLEQLSSGTTRKRVTGQKLKVLTVPVPPSREQARIASRIEELFSEIDEGERALERVGQLVERYRQSVLKAAVTGELTRVWRADHASDANAAMIGAEYLPAGWKRSSLEALSTKVTSGSRDWRGLYGRGDGVFIMAQNVRPGRLDLSELQLVDPPVGSKDAERSQVAEGDLLITIVGAKTGDICRVDRPLQKHYVCQSVALVRLADPQLSPYVELFLMADEGGQAQFAETIYGAGRPHLSFDQIKAVSVPLPPPEEQAAILDAVRRAESELQATIKVVATSRHQATALRQAILKAAFSGQLVPQDPRDEPASALLARLAAQAAEAPAAPRRRGAPRKNALA